MDPTCSTLETHGPPPVQRPQDLPTRRRTLGTCIHCHMPVQLDDAFVRLQRRAWHLDCALVSATPSTRRID